MGWFKNPILPPSLLIYFQMKDKPESSKIDHYQFLISVHWTKVSDINQETIMNPRRISKYCEKVLREKLPARYQQSPKNPTKIFWY